MFLFCFVLSFYVIFIIFFPLPLSPLIPPSPQKSPHCCPCPWVLLPFCSIPPSPHFLPPLAVICSPSMSLPLFCLLVQFIHSILHMSEIIWYLSFPDWLISLSIISPGPSILPQRVKFSSFSQLSSIPLCKHPIVVLSIHLLMDPWAASIFWWLYIMLQWT